MLSLRPKVLRRGERLRSNMILITTQPGSERAALAEVLDALFVLDQRPIMYDTGARGSFVIRSRASLPLMIERLRQYPTRSIYHVYPLNTILKPLKVEDIISEIIELCCRLLPQGTSLAVRCRRRLNPYVTHSEAFERLVGQAILENFSPRGIKVDLENPDVIIMIHLYRELVGIGASPPSWIIRKRSRWDT